MSLAHSLGRTFCRGSRGIFTNRSDVVLEVGFEGRGVRMLSGVRVDKVGL